MNRTQIQLPDELYEASKALAERKEISLAELVRRGLEYMLAVHPMAPANEPSLDFPVYHLGGEDPFGAPDWRAALHTDRLQVAETPGKFGYSEDAQP